MINWLLSWSLSVLHCSCYFHLQVFHNDTKTFKKVNKTFWNCFKLFIYFLHFSFFSTYDKVEKKKNKYFTMISKCFPKVNKQVPFSKPPVVMAGQRPAMTTDRTKADPRWLFNLAEDLVIVSHYRPKVLFSSGISIHHSNFKNYITQQINSS